MLARRMTCRTSSADVSSLYFGGISLACEPGADAYATLLEREGKNRAVMIDPNIRAAFIQDIDAYRARLERMMGLADIVKVSDEDLNWMVPGPETLNDKARTLLAKGAERAHPDARQRRRDRVSGQRW